MCCASLRNQVIDNDSVYGKISRKNGNKAIKKSKFEKPNKKTNSLKNLFRLKEKEICDPDEKCKRENILTEEICDRDKKFKEGTFLQEKIYDSNEKFKHGDIIEGVICEPENQGNILAREFCDPDESENQVNIIAEANCETDDIKYQGNILEKNYKPADKYKQGNILEQEIFHPNENYKRRNTLDVIYETKNHGNISEEENDNQGNALKEIICQPDKKNNKGNILEEEICEPDKKNEPRNILEEICDLNKNDTHSYVIEVISEVDKKNNKRNILKEEICKRCEFNEQRNILDEVICDPDKNNKKIFILKEKIGDRYENSVEEYILEKEIFEPDDNDGPGNILETIWNPNKNNNQENILKEKIVGPNENYKLQNILEKVVCETENQGIILKETCDKKRNISKKEICDRNENNVEGNNIEIEILEPNDDDYLENILEIIWHPDSNKKQENILQEEIFGNCKQQNNLEKVTCETENQGNISEEIKYPDEYDNQGNVLEVVISEPGDNGDIFEEVMCELDNADFQGNSIEKILSKLDVNFNQGTILEEVFKLIKLIDLGNNRYEFVERLRAIVLKKECVQRWWTSTDDMIIGGDQVEECDGDVNNVDRINNSVSKENLRDLRDEADGPINNGFNKAMASVTMCCLRRRKKIKIRKVAPEDYYYCDSVSYCCEVGSANSDRAINISKYENPTRTHFKLLNLYKLSKNNRIGLYI